MVDSDSCIKGSCGFGAVMNQGDPSWLPVEIRSRLDRLALAIGSDRSDFVVAVHNHLACPPNWASTQSDQQFCDQQFFSRPWIAVVSSHLGHNPILHRDVCRNLAQAMIQCRRRDAVLLVAAGSAIQPWAIRAAELFGVSVLQVVIGAEDAKSDTPALRIQAADAAALPRDAAVIHLADRVDAVYVRRKGKIAQALLNRVSKLQDATTRVASTRLPKCAAKELIQAGAIGWVRLPPTLRQQGDVPPLVHKPTFEDDWMHQDGEWLVHCTRACDGPWPGQTESQYRDELLLGVDAPARTPVQTLQRIIRSRRLIASAIVSVKTHPVVCFSSVAIADLLIARAYRPHLKRWDYEPWGIAVRKSAAISLGVQEVIYGSAKDRNQILSADQYRFQAAGQTFDWTNEKEWRLEGDLPLDAFATKDVRVFVANEAGKRLIETYCPWQISVL